VVKLIFNSFTEKNLTTSSWLCLCANLHTTSSQISIVSQRKVFVFSFYEITSISFNAQFSNKVEVKCKREEKHFLSIIFISVARFLHKEKICLCQIRKTEDKKRHIPKKLRIKYLLLFVYCVLCVVVYIIHCVKIVS
jgi:hypothetical protein